MHGYYDDEPPGIFRRVFGPTLDFFGALRHEPLEWLVYETPRGVFWFCATTLVLMFLGFTDFTGAFEDKFAHATVEQPASEFADDLSTKSNPFSKPAAASEEYNNFLTAATVPEEEAATTDEDLFAFVDVSEKPADKTEAESSDDEVESVQATAAEQTVAEVQTSEAPAAKSEEKNLYAELFEDDPEERKEAAVKGKELADMLFPEKKKPQADNIAAQSRVPDQEAPGSPVAASPKPEPPQAEIEDLFAEVVETEEKTPPTTPATEKPESSASAVVEAEVETNQKRQPEPKVVRDETAPALPELTEILGDKPRIIIEYLGDLKDNLSNSEPKAESKTAEVKSPEKNESKVPPIVQKENKEVAEVPAPAQQAEAAAPATKPAVKPTPRKTPPTVAQSNATQQKKTATVQSGHWEDRIERRQVICQNGRTCNYVNVRVRVWVPASAPATRSVATYSQPQRSHSAPVVCGQRVRYSNCAQVQNTGYSTNQNGFGGRITQHRQQNCNAGGFRPFKRIGNFLRGGQRWR